MHIFCYLQNLQEMLTGKEKNVTCLLEVAQCVNIYKTLRPVNYSVYSLGRSLKSPQEMNLLESVDFNYRCDQNIYKFSCLLQSCSEKVLLYV